MLHVSSLRVLQNVRQEIPRAATEAEFVEMLKCGSDKPLGLKGVVGHRSGVGRVGRMGSHFWNSEGLIRK
jgi:hypothetical protein